MTEKELARLEFAKKSVEFWPPNEISPKAKIHHLSVIGGDGFGWARDTDGTLIKVNHAGNVTICDYVEVRAFVTIDRAVNGTTYIGEGNKIDNHVHVAHNAKIGNWNTFANGCCIEGSVEIGHNNTFGGNVVVQRKVKIGSNNIFGSGCVVTKDVGDNGVYVGNPARKLKDNG